MVHFAMSHVENNTRTKLTRRRGACKECRLRKVRCDGGHPCGRCKPNLTACEYTYQHSARSNSTGQDDTTCTSASSSSNSTYGTITPDHQELFGTFCEHTQVASMQDEFFPQFASPLTPSSIQLSTFLRPQQSIPGGEGESSQPTALHSELPYAFHGSNFVQNTSDSIVIEDVDRSGTLSQLFFTDNGSNGSSTDSTLPSVFARVLYDVQNKTETPESPAICDAACFLQNTDAGSSQQHNLLQRIRRLLFLAGRPCTSSLWQQASHDREWHALDLQSLPTDRLIQTLEEPGGLNTFVSMRQVKESQSAILDLHKPPTHVTDFAILFVTLARGASLVTGLSSSTMMGLAHGVQQLSKHLLEQSDTVNKFLALVAMLCLAERVGTHDISKLIIGAVSTAFSLKLHSKHAMHSLYMSDVQTAQVQRALCKLYCIEKTYELRWERLPIQVLSTESLIPAGTHIHILNSEVPAPSLELLQIRLQYTHICMDILRLRRDLDKSVSENTLSRLQNLVTTLDVWYRSVASNQKIRSLEVETARSIQNRAFCLYHEALLHLGCISFSYQHLFSFSTDDVGKELRRRSIREVFTNWNTVSHADLVQDSNIVLVNTLALCLLALDSSLEREVLRQKENHALLSIGCGFFAKIEIAYPNIGLFEAAMSIVNILERV